MSRSLAAFSSLMEAMGKLAARSGSAGRVPAGASLPWAAQRPGSGPSGLSSWPPSAGAAAATGSPHRSPLFGMSDLNALWRFAAHRKILEASEKLLCGSQALAGGLGENGTPRNSVPPVPLFQ